MKIEVAGHCLELLVPPEFLPAIENSYALFKTSRAPEITVTIQTTPKATTANGPWGECVLHRNFMHFFDDHCLGWCDFSLGQGMLTMLPENILGPLGSFLRNILTALVVRAGGGLMLHAAGILSAEETLIFVGPSGAGKSTVARFSSPRTVLSDEQLFIKKEEGNFMVYPAPVWGDTQTGARQNKPYPLKGMFKLVQDKIVRLEPISPAIAAAELFSMPEILSNSSEKENLLMRYQELALAVPCWELHFKEEPSFWENIKKLPSRAYAKV